MVQRNTHRRGEDSPYKVFVIDDSAYNEQDEFKSLSTDNVADKLNDFQDQYQKYIEDFKFSNAFKTKFSDAFDENGKLKINFADFFDNNDISTSEKIRFQRSFDPLIGHYDEDDKSMNGSLNDICKPMIQEITKNIGTSGNNALDKAQFKYYYWAIENEIYKMACGESFDTCGKTKYEAEKDGVNGIIESWNGAHVNRGLDIPFDLYITENGTTSLNPRIFDEMDKIVNAAVERFKIQGISVTKEDIHNILNLSFTISAIQGTHDLTVTWPVIKDATPNNENEGHGTANCATNEMVDAIGGVKSADMVANIVPTKLNKSIFSHDYGRELV